MSPSPLLTIDCPECAKTPSPTGYIQKMTPVRESTTTEGKVFRTWSCPKCNHTEEKEIDPKTTNSPGRRYY